MSVTTPEHFKRAVAHMNADHRGSLRAILQYHLSLPRPPTSASMTRLDSRGFEIEYTEVKGFWIGGETKSGVRIDWKGGEEVKEPKRVRELLVAMTEESQEKRNKRYPILYSPPRLLPGAIFLLALLFYLTSPNSLSPNQSILPSSLISLLKPYKTQLQKTTLPFLVRWIVIAHTLESSAMFIWVLLKGGLGSVGQAILWSASTFPLGFPTFKAYRQLNPKAALQD